MSTPYILEVVKQRAAQAVAASQSNQVVSDEFQLTSAALTSGFRVEVHYSAITDGSADTSIVAKLQWSPVVGDAASWSDFDGTNCKVASGATGWFSIPVSPGNSNYTGKFPLRAFWRVVVSTAAGDAATVDSIKVHLPH